MVLSHNQKTNWRLAVINIPRIDSVNKMDRQGSDFDGLSTS
jgi:translation elongation factor EF-G